MTIFYVGRRNSGGGELRRLLVDFLIGAHAELRAERLLTLDPSRYTQDFPALRLMEVGLLG
jgi:predicted nucleic acid-binding protein